jgi:hypothetical protein
MNCPKCGAAMELRPGLLRGLLTTRGCQPDRTVRLEVCPSCDYVVFPEFENPDGAGCLFEHFKD